MADYITKLYQLTGVQKGFLAYKNCDEDTYTGIPIYSGDKKFFTSYEQAKKEDYFIPYYVKDDEEYYFKYPEFTAEKQLRLLLLFNRDFSMVIDNQEDDLYCVRRKDECGENSSNFAEAMAKCACKMLKKGYYDKILIKEILVK